MYVRVFRSMLGAVLVMLVTAGCQRSVTDEMALSEEAVLRRGWVAHRHIHARSIYCYRTLGRPDCYAEPVEGARHRLIGYYGEAPEDR